MNWNRRSRRVILAVAVSVAWIVSAPAQETIGEKGSWMTDKDAAFALSKETGRPLIVDVWADWCAPCKVMETRTFGHPNFLQVMRGFVPLKVNADADEKFAYHYQTNILPTTLFLDHGGRLLGKISGMIGPTDLVSIMNRILAGYSDYLEDLHHTDQPATQMAISGYLLRIGNTSGSVAVLQQTMSRIRNSEPMNQEQYEIIQLRLAGSLAADGKTSQAVRILEHLAESASNKEVQGRALFGLVKTERSRGELLKAEKALRRLKREYPDLAVRLN